MAKSQSGSRRAVCAGGQRAQSGRAGPHYGPAHRRDDRHAPVWAERYDRVLEDVFTVQDEITRNIVTALEVQLTSGEQVRLWRHGMTNPEAYDTFLRGRDYAMRKTREDTVQARRLFERAIALDPGFAMAYVGLASTWTLEVRLGWSSSLAEPLERARALTHKAIALDDALADAYGQLGYILLLQRQHDQSSTAGQ